MKRNVPLFITIEGGEGSGKTTHSLLLKKYLESKGFSVLLTREPGGTLLAESIRKILLNPDSHLVPLSELLLYEAARAQHIEEIILPALKSGKAVICDRFTDATVAYQGYGRKLDLQLIEKLNNAASFGIKPLITIYIDIKPDLGVNKAKVLDKESYGTSGDRIERESLSFHKTVRKGYLELAKKYPERIKKIKIKKDITQTQDEIRKAVDMVIKNV
ncbi:MAG: dTMP kinase [Endomicrobium sp.]|jgi:dTMP kinase|nr:dTMP kinase [Endomicrobium sp.]